MTNSLALLATFFPLASPFHGYIEVGDNAADLPSKLRPYADAVGAFRIFPFSNDKRSGLSCTAIHLGNGLALTAGHCFFGARECNGAFVTFGARFDRAPQKTWLSQCLEVIAIQSDESRVGSRGEDFALFRISNPPPAHVTLETSARPHETTVLSMMSYPISLSHNVPSLAWSGLCQVKQTTVVDSVGRPRPLHTFSHNCIAEGGSGGAPIFDYKTQKVVGMHSSLFHFAPVTTVKENDGNEDAQTLSLAKVIADSSLPQHLSARHHNKTHPFGELHVGHFSPDVFPSGLKGNISLKVVTFPRALSVSVSFRVKRGIETSVQIKSGKGVLLLRGIASTSDNEFFSLPTPVEISAYNDDSARSLSVDITDISPN